MGRPLIQQKRGKGGPRYRVPNYSFRPNITYKDQTGRVVDIVNQVTRNPPLAKVRYPDNKVAYLIAPEGMKVGDSTSGLVQKLADVQAGKQISCIESYPNSGPRFCMTSGSAATLVSKGPKTAIIQMPSKKTKVLNLECRAMLGVPAGDGRKEKPWVKAGKKWHAMHARGKYYPRTSGNKMNALDHPFGGSSKSPGKSKSVS
ncbi:MAG: 50S ribosomal protein L2, partial [Candidatus Aenigmatarchaeota archaeon]